MWCMFFDVGNDIDSICWRLHAATMMHTNARSYATCLVMALFECVDHTQITSACVAKNWSGSHATCPCRHIILFVSRSLSLTLSLSLSMFLSLHCAKNCRELCTNKNNNQNWMILMHKYSLKIITEQVVPLKFVQMLFVDQRRNDARALCAEY